MDALEESTQSITAPLPLAENSSPSPDRFQADQVAVIAVGHFTHDTYTAFLAPLLPLIQNQLGLSYALAGGLAIFAQLPSLLNPFIGYLADRVSVRYFVILAPAVTATVFSSIGLASTYLVLALLLFAGGLSIAAFHAPAPAMIGKVSGPRVGAGMSVFMASGELARAVGPIVAVAGVTWFGLEGVWRLAAVGWLVSGVLFFRLRSVPVTPRSHRATAMSRFWPAARRVFPPLTWLLLGRIFMLAALSTYLPIFMSDVRGAGLGLAAVSLTALEAAGVVGALVTGTVSDRLGRKRVLFVLLGLAPFALLLFIFGPEWLTFPLLIALGLMAISPQPVMLAFVQDHFPGNRALANGAYLAITFMMRALGIWVVGMLADMYGLNIAFAACALLALLSVPAVFFLPTSPAQSKRA
ncbi:MAG: MFS transporter [Chloroflexi bacterium]|nr:MFS transporter [Chloroflexota bacterium]